MTLQASCLSSCQAWHEHHSIHHHCRYIHRHHHHHVLWNYMDFSLQCFDDDLDDAFGWWAHVTNNIFTAYWLWHKLFSLSLAFEFSPKTTHLSTIFCEKYIDVEENSYCSFEQERPKLYQIQAVEYPDSIRLTTFINGYWGVFSILDLA